MNKMLLYRLVIAFFLVYVAPHVRGQIPDSTNQRIRSFSTSIAVQPTQQQIVVIGNVSFKTSNLVLSSMEREIAELESKECMAHQKRDTVTLREFWVRDFTLDYPDELVKGRNPIPYYVSYHRLIEQFSVYEGIVYTSGSESFRQLDANGKLGDLVQRPFTHSWARINGVWKLVSKKRI